MSNLTTVIARKSSLFVLPLLLFAGKLRAQNNGDRDTSFHTGTGSSHMVQALGVLPNGNIFAGGDMDFYNGQSVSGMVVLQPNGTPDATFMTNLSLSTNASVRGGFVESNGNILIGGFFTTVNGLARKNLARLKPNGFIDSAFTVGTGVNNEVTCIHSNGQKIAISGFFSQYNGNSRSGFAYLNNDGTLDTSFSNPSWSSFIQTQVVLPNGKILVGGNFSSFHNAPTNRIARLNPDGSADTTFNPGSGASSLVKTIVVQPDNKILIGGGFSTIDGNAYNGIARLHPDGSIDTTFSSYFASNAGVGELLVLPNGKILVGGTFYNTSSVFLKMLNPDGSLDTTFAVGIGTNGSIHSLALQADNKMLVGGAFTQYQGSAAPRLMRLHGDTAQTVPAVPVFSQPQYTATCFGDTVILEITGGNIAPTDHWEWRINDCLTTLLDTGISVKYAPQNDTTTFAVKSSGGANCAFVQLIVADTVPPQNNSPLPMLSAYCEVVIQPQDAPVAIDFCVGSVVGIPQGPLTYSMPGNYTLPWLFDDGHGNTAIDTQHIEVLAIDTAVIYDSIIPWKLHAVHTSPTAKYTWVQCVGGQFVQLDPSDTLQSYLAQLWGEYAVIITEGNCTDTSYCKLAQPWDVPEYSANHLLNVYPNPATNEVLIYCDEANGLGELSILNLNGQLLYREDINVGKDHKVNLQNLPNGVYLVQVRTSKYTMTQRLVKL